MGEALDRLDGAGWHTLHSIPLPGGGRVHHLAIGPAGLFAIHTLYARKQRVLVVDPRRLCPNGRACEGELDEGFWIPYDEYAAGWDGLVHWVDFYGIRRKQRGESVPTSLSKRSESRGSTLGNFPT